MIDARTAAPIATLTEAFMDRLRGENVPGHQSPAALLLLGHAEQMERGLDEYAKWQGSEAALAIQERNAALAERDEWEARHKEQRTEIAQLRNSLSETQTALADQRAQARRDVCGSARMAGIVEFEGAPIEDMPIEGVAEALRELAASYREDSKESARALKAVCAEMRDRVVYAGSLEGLLREARCPNAPSCVDGKITRQVGYNGFPEACDWCRRRAALAKNPKGLAGDHTEGEGSNPKRAPNAVSASPALSPERPTYESEIGLKPCPFCGGTDIVAEFSKSDSGYVAAGCMTCGACGPESYTARDSAMRWNTGISRPQVCGDSEPVLICRELDGRCPTPAKCRAGECPYEKHAIDKSNGGGDAKG